MIGLTEIPASSLLQQEKFQWLAASEFISAIAGVAVALTLAVSGAGASALVWQQLTQRITKGLVINYASSFRPAFVLDSTGCGEHLRFALDTVGWSIMTFVGRQADTLIVGKVSGGRNSWSLQRRHPRHAAADQHLRRIASTVRSIRAWRASILIRRRCARWC